MKNTKSHGPVHLKIKFDQIFQRRAGFCIEDFPNPQLTSIEIEGLRIFYNQLPGNARAWIEERTHHALL